MPHAGDPPRASASGAAEMTVFAPVSAEPEVSGQAAGESGVPARCAAEPDASGPVAAQRGPETARLEELAERLAAEHPEPERSAKEHTGLERTAREEASAERPAREQYDSDRSAGERAEPAWPSRIGRGHVVGMAALLTLAVAAAGVLMLRHRPVTQPVTVASPATGTLGPSALTGAASEQAPPAHTGSAPAGPPSETVLLVHVAGKVRKPGVVELPPGARVLDAVRKAGGARPGVDLSTVNLARPVTDGEQILVGIPGARVAGPDASSPAAGPGVSAAPLSLNQATLEQLEQLPGIGPVLAQRILEARDERGGFRTLEELLEVSGIAERRLAELRDRVTVP